MTAQCPYDKIDTVKMDVGNGGRICPVCKRRICTRCGKPDLGSWMTGHCNECYSVTSRLTRRSSDSSDTFWTQSTVITFFENNGASPDLVAMARAHFEREEIEWPEPEMWTPPESREGLKNDDYEAGRVPA
jgi:hypothetical protein